LLRYHVHEVLVYDHGHMERETQNRMPSAGNNQQRHKYADDDISTEPKAHTFLISVINNGTFILTYDELI